MLSASSHGSLRLSMVLAKAFGPRMGCPRFFDQLKQREEYVDGKRNGIRETYSADGVLELREVWEGGELVSSTDEDD